MKTLVFTGIALLLSVEVQANFSVHMNYGDKRLTASVAQAGKNYELITSQDGVLQKRPLKKKDYDYLLRKISAFPKESDGKDCGREKIELVVEKKLLLRGCARSTTPASEALRQLLDLLFSV